MEQQRSGGGVVLGSVWPLMVTTGVKSCQWAPDFAAGDSDRCGQGAACAITGDRRDANYLFCVEHVMWGSTSPGAGPG